MFICNLKRIYGGNGDTVLKLKNKLKFNFNRHFLSDIISDLFRDKIYILMVMVIFIKSILFIGLLGTEKATWFDFDKAFMSVPTYMLFISFAMIVLSISFLFKGRKHLWSLIVIDILITVLIIGDAWYYRGFTEFLNFFLFTQTANLDNLSSSLLSMSRPVDVLFVIDIIIFIIYAAFNRQLYKGVKRNYAVLLFTFIVPFCYLSYDSVKVDVYSRCFDQQHTFYRSWAPTRTMSYLGPIGYHCLDAYNFINVSKKQSLTETDKGQIKSWIENNKENLPDNKYAGVFKGKNLLIIQWESLENFVVNQKFQDQEITPNLNKLLKTSLYFNNYHENVNNGTSSDADLMTNTGVYPVRDGSTFFRYPNNKYKNSLPELMEGLGYSTFALHPDKGLYWNWKPALQSIGFNTCYDSSKYNTQEVIGLGISDRNYLEQVAPIIEKEKKPFYTFMVTLTSHSPFDLPEKDRTMNLANGFNFNILGDYFQSIHYTDTVLGSFLEELKKSGTLDNTVVAIYGDHTGVHKYYSDKVAQISPLEDWWSDNDMRIPLIIYNKDLEAKTFDVQAGQIDLMPTIAYMMGIDKSKYQDTTFGKVLVNTNKNYTILNNLTSRGKCTPAEEKHMIDGIKLSDKMVQSDYFKDK